MAITIGYDPDHRLTLSGLSCDCPLEHRMPAQDIYVGADLIARLPAYIKRRNLGTKCVLVADEHTYRAAGEAARRALCEAGFQVFLCLMRRPAVMEPDEAACGEVLLSIQPETEFLVAVGAGVVTDVVRVNAVRCGLPFVCVGTAPSMDGYTSTIAPLLLRGVKIHRAAVCPAIIVCDLTVMRNAPAQMLRWGVGDVLGKYIAKADWMLGAIVNDEPYCTMCGQMVMDAVDKLLANIKEIRERTEEGVRILIEALILAGMTTMIVGHTRAVASIEHNIVHLWDMRALAEGRRPPSHGEAVGVSTLLVWPLFERFAQESPGAIWRHARTIRGISREARVAALRAAYGSAAADEIMAENPGDFLSEEARLRRVRRACERFDEVREVLGALPPFARLQEAMRALGAPLTAAEIGISRALCEESLYFGKDYRERYSLFKLLDECGLLAPYIDEEMRSWQD